MNDKAFTIRIHLADGSIHSYRQPHAALAKKIIDSVEPARIFARPRLVVAGERYKSVFATAHVLRVDFIHPDLPLPTFSGRYADIVDLDEPEFRKHAFLDEPAKMAHREQHTPVGDLLVSFLELQMVGGKRYHLMTEFPVKLPAENQSFVNYLLS